MSVYTMLFEYIRDYIFNDNSLSAYETTIMGVSTDLSVWLSHTATIVLMVLFLACLISFLVWLFKFVSGLILLKR